MSGQRNMAIVDTNNLMSSRSPIYKCQTISDRYKQLNNGIVVNYITR